MCRRLLIYLDLLFETPETCRNLRRNFPLHSVEAARPPRERDIGREQAEMIDRCQF